MALKSWLESLQADVSPVSAVQANNGVGFARYGTKRINVSDVSAIPGFGVSDTVDTVAENQTYQHKPSIHEGCTSETVDTLLKLNIQAFAANDPFAKTHRSTDSEPKRVFQERRLCSNGGRRLAASTYYAHHFQCQTCIAAGQGSRYGSRCEFGLSLWDAYRSAIDLSQNSTLSVEGVTR